VMSGVVVGGLLLSGGYVFASSSNSSDGSQDTGTGGKPAIFGEKMGHRGGMMGKGGFFGGGRMLSQDTLDQLVKDKVITEAKASAIKTFVDNKEKELPGYTL
ncbi:MAG TPA: hypothetical protein VHS59_08200, partial [Bacillota bacterium]|nr:hypothetical protein [Bacillota bacterium]